MATWIVLSRDWKSRVSTRNSSPLEVRSRGNFPEELTTCPLAIGSSFERASEAHHEFSGERGMSWRSLTISNEVVLTIGERHDAHVENNREET